ncbi:phenol degradation protein meta [Bosea sp. Root483D1]|uniref:SphA family protein n=1 Tax=Bosea sp. Root483D1 TaxID=1736544 RepID=UPI00070E20A7|nr:transporter [Bosea sp. Root483D1]KRE20602.1 phenol degradation protein meta [Bosea sp. Root483D1]
MSRLRAAAIGTLALCAAALSHGVAQATESGASLYIPGTRGPAAGIVPPPGFYFENDFYSYSGRLSAATRTQIGGAVLANVKVQARADFLTPTWITPLEILGGNLGFAVTIPVGNPRISAGTVIAAPRLGRVFGLKQRDSGFFLGDPVVSSFIGWHAGNFHWQVGGSVNIPSGTYDPDRLSNLSFNRVIGDIYAAATWLDPKIGLDISAAVGLELNGKNNDTDYKSGNAVHVDLAVSQYLSKEFSIGALFSHYQQISGDSGSGASLGPYKGRTTAVGGTIAYSFAVAGTPVTARLKVLREVSVENRPQGTIAFVSLAFPLGYVPPAAPAAEPAPRVVKH